MYVIHLFLKGVNIKIVAGFGSANVARIVKHPRDHFEYN